MKTQITIILLIFFSLRASGQTPPDGENVSYGSHPREKLDFWIAPNPDSPIIILVQIRLALEGFIISQQV